MSVVLSVDVGTYEAKGVLVDEDGHIVASHCRPHRVTVPQPGHVEYDPEAVWWDGSGFLDICSIDKCLAKCPSACGVFVALVVAEDVIHHGRSAADRGHDHVAVDGLGYVGGLVATVSLIS
jgi:hypothetical protein